MLPTYLQCHTIYTLTCTKTFTVSFVSRVRTGRVIRHFVPRAMAIRINVRVILGIYCYTIFHYACTILLHHLMYDNARSLLDLLSPSIATPFHSDSLYCWTMNLSLSTMVSLILLLWPSPTTLFWPYTFFKNDRVHIQILIFVTSLLWGHYPSTMTSLHLEYNFLCGFTYIDTLPCSIRCTTSTFWRRWLKFWIQFAFTVPSFAYRWKTLTSSSY